MNDNLKDDQLLQRFSFIFQRVIFGALALIVLLTLFEAPINADVFVTTGVTYTIMLMSIPGVYVRFISVPFHYIKEYLQDEE